MGGNRRSTSSRKQSRTFGESKKHKLSGSANSLERLQHDLQGDVKKLTNHTPEYRLRVGDYRVLFEIDGTDRVIVYRIMHRQEAYR